MSMPPEASGPVFTVIRPKRIGPDWANPMFGRTSEVATAPPACTNRLRLKLMSLLLNLREELLIGDYPAQAARDVLQAERVKVVAVHARHAVGQHHDPVVEVEGGE